MIAWLQQLLGGSGSSRELSLSVQVDHVELSSAHLVLGLALTWYNRTAHHIPIKEIQLVFYHHGRKADPLVFYPLERFRRVPTKLATEKSPVGPFALPTREKYTEQLRFISQEVLDLPVGSYSADVQVIDTDDLCYTNRVALRVEAAKKYRHDEAWQTTQN